MLRGRRNATAACRKYVARRFSDGTNLSAPLSCAPVHFLKHLKKGRYYYGTRRFTRTRKQKRSQKESQ